MTFVIKGCIVKVDFYFILVLAIAAVSGTDELIYLLLFSSLHELGHLMMLAICKGTAEQLTFSYYGFALKYADNLSRNKEALVILSGPFVNMILYLVLKDDINLILFLLNMLPVFPLDGGRLLKLYFHNVSKAVSIIILIVIYFLAIYLITYNNSFSLLLIALYLTVYILNY
ncbi:MAG: site-2 protease family protein [Eubacterium sp.]